MSDKHTCPNCGTKLAVTLADHSKDKPMKISMDKQYQTRDGRKVVLYCVDAPSSQPVHGRIEHGGISSWSVYGSWSSGACESNCDLIELPAPRSAFEVRGWVNIYPQQRVILLKGTRGEADLQAGGDRIACIPITIQGHEGDGLDREAGAT